MKPKSCVHEVCVCARVRADKFIDVCLKDQMQFLVLSTSNRDTNDKQMTNKCSLLPRKSAHH